MNWIAVKGVVKPGYGVASGQGDNTPYPRGSIAMQAPFFQQLGLDLTPYFSGTLNVSIAPHQFAFIQPEYAFRQVKWYAETPPEDFSFSPCRLIFQEKTYSSLIYYPHPDTKPQHFQDRSTLEILAPLIPSIAYNSIVKIELSDRAVKIFHGGESERGIANNK
ncbi:MAG: hypothetical protein J7647_12985 [Cyanobacteria bacterium SBLK]|nr:hypothetical protein [Cyanobacteria bacterium SBLK]